MGKVIIFSAPSGAGKSTIVNYLLEKGLGLEFSISATCRAPRGKEIHGKEYYFFTADEFRKRIENKEFLESAKPERNEYSVKSTGSGRKVILYCSMSMS